MLRLGTFLVVLCLSTAAVAEQAQVETPSYTPQISDLHSLQRGLRLFVNYCMGCHSARYVRYQRIAEDLRIPEEIMQRNLMFGTDKLGAHMTTGMSKEDGKRFFKAPPPDLSVVGRSRGASWLYAYLTSFYLDESRPSGVNNLLFPDTAMPHALWELQGFQRAVYRLEKGPMGESLPVIDHLEQASVGSLDKEAYALAVGDLVNFLYYIGEPALLKRSFFGPWVLLYLALLILVTWLLKKEYWKDVH